MWQAITDSLLSQGLAGIAIIVLSFVIWKLYGEIQRFQDVIQKIQDARVLDANKTTETIVALTRSIDKNSEAMHDAIEALRDRR